jgi:hypothetical protein
VEHKKKGKERVNWKKLKPKVKIKHLLSRDGADDQCGDEKRKQAENVKQSKGEG